MKKSMGSLLLYFLILFVITLLACTGSGGGGGGNHGSVQESWTDPAGASDNISPDGQNAIVPQVAMDGLGNALVVWQQLDGTTNCGGQSCSQIYMSEYRNGIWTHPANLGARISLGGQDATFPQVAMDDLGNALVVWQQFDGSTNCSGQSCSQIYIYEYRNSTWIPPAHLGDVISLPGQDATAPQVAMDDIGNAVVVWQQLDGTTNCSGSQSCSQIYKREYRNGGWTGPAHLGDSVSQATDDSIMPRVSMDDNGNAIIVWTQFAGSVLQVFGSEFRTVGWNAPLQFSLSGQIALLPQVAMDNNGNALVVWEQYNNTTNCGGLGCTQIFKSEYRNGSWIHPSGFTDNLSPDNESASFSQVAMDNNGNAVVVWQQNDGNFLQIFKSEYRSGSWTRPANLNNNISPDDQDATFPQVAMDDNSNAIIVWQQQDGSTNCAGQSCYQTYRSEFRIGSWTVPTSLIDNFSPDVGDPAVQLLPEVAMDNNGDAIIVWHQHDNTGGCSPFGCTQIFKSEYR